MVRVRIEIHEDLAPGPAVFEVHKSTSRAALMSAFLSACAALDLDPAERWRTPRGSGATEIRAHAGRPETEEI